MSPMSAYFDGAHAQQQCFFAGTGAMTRGPIRRVVLPHWKQILGFMIYGCPSGLPQGGPLLLAMVTDNIAKRTIFA